MHALSQFSKYTQLYTAEENCDWFTHRDNSLTSNIVSLLSLLIFIFVPLLLNLVKIKIKCCSLFTDCSLVLKFIQVYCDWIDWISILGKKSGNTVAMRYTCKNSIILSFKSCDCLIYDLGDCYFIIKFLRRYVFLWGHLLTHFAHFNTFRFKPTGLEL